MVVPVLVAELDFLLQLINEIQHCVLVGFLQADNFFACPWVTLYSLNLFALLILIERLSWILPTPSSLHFLLP